MSDEESVVAGSESVASPQQSGRPLSYRQFKALAHKGAEETYFLDKYVFRHISILGSYVLSFTRIPPNVVTFVSLLCTMAAVWFFMDPTVASLLIGCGLVFSYHYLDHVDGELARVYAVTRGYQKGIAGAYFDLFCHSLSVNLWLPALAFGVYQQTGEPLVMLLGILAMPALSNFAQYVGAYMLMTRLVADPALASTEHGRAAMESVAGRFRQVEAVQAGLFSVRGVAKLAKEIIGYPGMLFLVIFAALGDALLGTVWIRLSVIALLAAFHGANTARRMITIFRRFTQVR